MTDDIDMDALQRDLNVDLKAGLQDLGPALAGSKFKQHQILTESAMNGGPTTTHNAIQLLLERANLGVRPLSLKLGVKRKKLQQMINGEIDMPTEVLSKICDEIERWRPGMIDKLKNMKFED